MKKVLSLVALTGILVLGTVNNSIAQESNDTTASTEMVDTVEQSSPAKAATPKPVATEEEAVEEEKGFHTAIKRKFIEGGPAFMGIVLLVLILGLALCIERIIYLNLATTNTEVLLEKIEAALNSGGIEAAKEVCKNTPGPVASIFYQGLDRSDEGIEIVEKSIIAYGSVQMGLLEKGVSWISLFIALAPMLGFMGTVIGMIEAFDAIQEAGDISPSLVAGGIKVALLTTVFGLITAIILQIFYNYIVSKVDNLVNSMEDASISLVDLLVKSEIAKK